MRIGLISDTHIPQVAHELSEKVDHAFEGVDLILHAGDIYVPSCLDWLERVAPVRAVEMSAVIYFERDPRVAYKQVLEVRGYTMGLVHDLMLRCLVGGVRPGVLSKAFPEGYSLPTVLRDFFGTQVDIVVFGHTHELIVEAYQGVLMINPGSPTLPSPKGSPVTVAILYLTPEGPEASIVDLS